MNKIGVIGCRIGVLASLCLSGYLYAQTDTENKEATSCAELVAQGGGDYVFVRQEPTGNGGYRCYSKHKNDDGEVVNYTIFWPKEPYEPEKAKQGAEVFAEEGETVESTSYVSDPYQRVNSNPEKGVEVINDCKQNKAVLVDYNDPLTGEPKQANIPYNERGLPVFDDVTKFTTRIDKSKDYNGQLRQATEDLKKEINAGTFAAANFTSLQQQDIQAGKGSIADYTWHHNPDNGSMQLVPRKVHDQTKHVGQGALCKGK